jgi:hypothetical protein
MSWFSKKPQRQAEPQQVVQQPSFKAVYYTESDASADPDLVRIAHGDDAAALQKSMTELDMSGRAGVIMWLGLPPVTSAKAATLSLYLSDTGILAEGASFALWQLLMSAAKPDELALLERVASPVPTHAGYDDARAVVSRLMTSALGRDLKAGEMESVTHLLGRHVRLTP